MRHPALKIQTTAVHAGDRKKPGKHIPVTTPIYTAASYFYGESEMIDKIFGHEAEGYAYARYDNPTNAALEELMASLEAASPAVGGGSLATASGMVALQATLLTALAERRKRVLCAEALYGATVKLLLNVLEPWGIETRFVDVCDDAALAKAVESFQPGCILMETVSNPTLRIGDLVRIASLSPTVNAELIVDNTFATPLLVRPLEHGADYVVHSLTKYLAGHGDVMGGAIIARGEKIEEIRTMSRVVGPVLGPFEAYLAMRGMKTFPLRMERQCRNAAMVAEFLRSHPAVDRVYYLDDPAHPDRANIEKLFTDGLYGAMVSFEIRGADKHAVFRFIDRLKLVVGATSLGDVHSMVLHPWTASHRDVSPKQKERTGVTENLVRLSVGIEDSGDIVADLAQALG
ncbi:MAG: PLP-dependent aspartate aminotransferase family protein [Bryobacterales bacterium]|nr:PLP-dependent aspartate aminotransferase family protein [Bryobacterales bacterium]